MRKRLFKKLFKMFAKVLKEQQRKGKFIVLPVDKTLSKENNIDNL
jgi:hypothetical protein